MAVKTNDGEEISAAMADGSVKRPQEPTSRIIENGFTATAKRRCVSTACIACRRRKSKCDGQTPSCAACASVYGTECVYDPSSDNRRKGVYKKTIDSLRTRDSTLQTLIQAILSHSEEEVVSLVREIRSCESLDDVADSIVAASATPGDEHGDDEPSNLEPDALLGPTFERVVSAKMGELQLEDGSVRFLGGTSNLIFGGGGAGATDRDPSAPPWIDGQHQQQSQPITSWTTVISEPELVEHLLKMYFTWHYTYFATLSRSLFWKDFIQGKPPEGHRPRKYCSALLVNAMLALGCHFTSVPGARANALDPATAGDHFFREAKHLLLDNDEHEKPTLTTVQALALMSVREAGCGREAKGWIYSGMSFRMAFDVGLNLHSGTLGSNQEVSLDDEAEDARRITLWGCFLFDKCWSNYLGRQPQLPSSAITVPKIDVFPLEDAAPWAPYTDEGFANVGSQPAARTRAIALQITSLCEISGDLLTYFYHPTQMDRPVGKSVEMKRLGEIHRRLEVWKYDLPREMEAREGALPNVLLMHMFCQLLYIHLFRPFLKYNQKTSPLPPQVSPRRLCTQAAAAISKLMRLYKRTYGLRQICNIAVYIAHSACTIHLLNLPDKGAKRDVTYGVRHLEEIAEGWPCANRTLSMLGIFAQRWNIQLPGEAEAVLGPMQYDENAREESSSSPPSATTLFASESAIDYPADHGRLPLSSSSRVVPPSSCSSTSSPSLGTTTTTTTTATTLLQPAPPPSDDPRLLVHANAQADLGFGALPQYATQPRQQLPAVDVAMSPSRAPDPVTSTAAALSQQSSPSVVLSNTNGLVQESGEWWFKDQSAYQTGFENWHGYAADLQGTGADASIVVVDEGIPYSRLDTQTQPNALSNVDWYA